ncbi:N-acetyllactosaminide alpha-1,3-galactosyltransferase-like 1 isoform X4 [Herpailurus yagouaroundi]|uniref:N-acetyllactosaminide alpha-1,3-galactosyltransferase-like 1 isoform X4 n=1 Tax=Herpailurus yagouaroundi TaxID=1608482 RepID=UPI001AD63FE8|nr:N-acetyllactosaminide alpha-1,3-galactosyltransferase-like 1 isoform X4 [Puma yagouaroundi]
MILGKQKERMKYRRKTSQLLLLLLFLWALYRQYHVSTKKLQKIYRCWSMNSPSKELKLSDWFSPSQSMNLTTTNWSAPVVWHGTFNEEVLEQYYAKHKITVGLTVFAVGRTHALWL